MTQTYILNCSNINCNSVRTYTNKRSWYNAIRKNTVCLECQKIKIKNTLIQKHETGEVKITPRRSDKMLVKNFFKFCPICNKEMQYVSEKTLNTAINNNTMCNRCSAYKYKKNFKNVITEKSICKMRATKAGYSSWDEYLQLHSQKILYKREVWRLTYKQPIKDLPNWERRGRCGVKDAYQLDHIVSITEGFAKRIPAEQIAHLSNLRMIPWKENLLKSNK